MKLSPLANKIAGGTVDINAEMAEISHHNINEIKVQIEQAVAKGDSKISVQMAPEALGKVDVVVNIIDGKYQFDFQVEQEQTLRLLQDNIEILRSHIIAVTKSPDNNFSFNLKDGNNNSSQQQEQHNNYADQKSVEVNMTDIENVNLSKDGGVNIKV